MTFGERLRTLRKASKKTQTQVAAELGMSQTRLSYYEKKTDLPRQAMLKKFADYYRVPLSYFVDEQSPGVERAREHILALRNQPAYGIAFMARVTPETSASRIPSDEILRKLVEEDGPATKREE